MGFLDELKDNASKAFDAAKAASEKAMEKGKDLAQQGKLSMEILTLENKMRDLKVDLADIAINADLFKENEEINNKLNEIADIKKQISAKKESIDLLK